VLSTAPLRAYIPVSNLQRARKFYEDGGGVIYRCGGTEAFLYQNPNAGTSKASQALPCASVYGNPRAALGDAGRSRAARSHLPRSAAAS